MEIVINEIHGFALPHNETQHKVFPINCSIMTKALQFTTFLNIVDKSCCFTLHIVMYTFCISAMFNFLLKIKAKINYISRVPFYSCLWLYGFVCGCVRLYAVVLVCVRLHQFVCACVSLCALVLVCVGLCWFVCTCVVLP